MKKKPLTEATIKENDAVVQEIKAATDASRPLSASQFLEKLRSWTKIGNG
jgi:hypothetical protein